MVVRMMIMYTMDMTHIVLTSKNLTSPHSQYLIFTSLDTNDIIIEYSRNTPNKYIMEDATIRYREHNRICADVVEVFLRIEDGILVEYSFDGYMSIIATACVSITGESLVGSDIAYILTLDESYVRTLIGDGISPRRRNASIIGLLAVKNAIHEYLADGKKEDFSDIMI